MFPHTVYSQVNQRPWTTRRCLSISVWCLLVSLLFRLAGFLCQWEVRLKKCNNAFSEPLLRDRAERSLAMPPPTGRQMALAHNKKFFFFKNPSFIICDQKWCIAYPHWCKWTKRLWKKGVEKERLLKHHHSHDPGLWLLRTTLYIRGS